MPQRLPPDIVKRMHATAAELDEYASALTELAVRVVDDHRALDQSRDLRVAAGNVRAYADELAVYIVRYGQSAAGDQEPADSSPPET